MNPVNFAIFTDRNLLIGSAAPKVEFMLCLVNFEAFVWFGLRAITRNRNHDCPVIVD